MVASIILSTLRCSHTLPSPLHFAQDGSRARRQRSTSGTAAAQAFGTGYHATTQSCLHALYQLRGRLKPQFVLDMGCGTGVLGMAAARIWSAPVYLCDYDPKAVEICQDNINKNNLRKRCHVFESFAYQKLKQCKNALPQQYDLILANILPNPLCEMAYDQARYLKCGGYLILSGLQQRHLQRILAVYKNFNIFQQRVYCCADWLAVVLCKK